MGRVKTLIVTVALIFGVICLSVFSHTTESWAYDKCLYIYEALLDTDNNESTGSNGDQVMVIQGGEISHAIHGIDYIVRVEADICATEGQELGPIRILRWNNIDSKFGLETSYPSTYGIGFGNGDITTPPHHADVIEFQAFKSDMGNPPGPMKIVYHASYSAATDNDYTAAFFYPERTFGVPSFSQWGMIILLVLLAVSAIWMLKKRNSATVRVLCSLLIVLSIAGIVSANLVCPEKICLDGLVEDWNEFFATPSVNDPVGDSSIGDSGEDIFKGYITSDDTHFYFRMDIVGGPR